MDFRGRKKKANKQPGAAVTQKDGEEKILNVSPDNSMFVETVDIFEQVLNELVVGNNEEVYEKLLQLQDVIQAKLSTFKSADEDTYKNADDMLHIKNLTSSRSLASSMQSLCSEESVSLESLAGNETFKKFLIKVNCPFCSKSENDKKNLIEHLDRNCQPLLNNEFEERTFIPFSAFQILPNNSIKCNVCPNSVLKSLKHYFLHSRTPFHRSQFDKAGKTKQYTDFLFCSCCKLLVPNNYTQLDYHMKHDEHKIRSAVCPKSEFYRDIDCVYLKTKKFKCLSCPSKCLYQSTKDILDHFEKHNHGKKLKNGMYPEAFCEMCMKEVPVFNIQRHLSSFDHTENEKSKALDDSYELCYYCNFVCKNLKELSVHIKTSCKEITSLRKQIQKTDKSSKNEKITKESSKKKKSEDPLPKSNKKTAGKKIEGDDSKKGLHIIVKDTTDVPEVYRYFKKFGEITRVELYKEKNVLIQFRDKSAMEDAVLLRDVIHINGVKMEITTDEVLTIPAGETKKLTKEREPEDVFESSDEDSLHSESSEEPLTAAPSTKLEDLFERVSRHLSNTTKTFGSSLEEKVLGDCALIFGPDQKCSVTGFSRTRLSFPVEMTDLYCDMMGTHLDNLGGTLDFQTNLIKRFYIKFCDSSNWRAVSSCLDSGFPHIQCTHVATQKSFRFIFTPSAKILTDMLSYCIGKVNGAENFCLIVRFWLNVHKSKKGLSDYVVISLLLYFLMNKYVPDNFFEIYDMPFVIVLFSRLVHDEIGCDQPAPKNKVPDSSNVVQMFIEFLKFLCKFNFKKNMIALPINYPVPRKIMGNMQFERFSDLSPLCLDSALFITDPLMCLNLARDMDQDDLELLLEAAWNTLKNTG